MCACIHWCTYICVHAFPLLIYVFYVVHNYFCLSTGKRGRVRERSFTVLFIAASSAPRAMPDSWKPAH